MVVICQPSDNILDTGYFLWTCGYFICHVLCVERKVHTALTGNKHHFFIYLYLISVSGSEWYLISYTEYKTMETEHPLRIRARKKARGRGVYRKIRKIREPLLYTSELNFSGEGSLSGKRKPAPWGVGQRSGSCSGCPTTGYVVF